MTRVFDRTTIAAHLERIEAEARKAAARDS
jgi:hypothetical protein